MRQRQTAEQGLTPLARWRRGDLAAVRHALARRTTSFGKRGEPIDQADHGVVP